MRSDAETDPTRHRAGPLPFAWGARPRDECWAALDEPVRARLEAYAGEIIDRWAYDQDHQQGEGGRVAGVFGTQGLCTATRTNDEGGPRYVVSGYRLDPRSVLTRSIKHRPDPAARLRRAPAAAAPETQPIDIGLSDEVGGLLGNLPPRAQAFLQAPFVTGRRVADFGWYYEGDERRLDVFIIYLVGEHDVTFATGTKDLPPGHVAATAHWDLVCHQATVIGRQEG
jgi:hypothetical protein